ncbi:MULTISPECIES: type II toxin-antitoxin system death-on-curing family toxin [Paenibacillus]|uniref:type II toxin-antitoxin system death-on-curing family toxin n=1 Tax=Paenibacillus TaxID=44249 RepID=UPI000884151F|nr:MULTISPECIES: type II toxin-antitoxin system death-on-curing family toxin [Paenibacillus]GCL73752.1 type II toxin-antitoxin system death-on-curing family toxin [Paenibacillus naphthalenovorans]SDI54943.1 death on curing protein [Paenibacillus naphthalenovorans]
MTHSRFLSVQEVIAINLAMIQRYSPGEQVGVKEPGLLESAVLRPQSSAFGNDAYPSIFEKAAALFESLGQNHPFHNANKRTAFTTLVIFLRYNGLYFKMDPKKAEDLTVDMENHKYEFQDLASIIQAHCVTITES